MANISDKEVEDMVRRANQNLQTQDMRSGKELHPAGDPVMGPVRRFYNHAVVEGHMSGVIQRFSNLF